MKTSKVIGLSIAMCSPLVAGVAGAQEMFEWSAPDTSTCATSIVPGWAIGCHDSGAVFEQVEILGTLGWLQVSGAFGKSVTLDRSDNPWVIDSAGGIHKWNGTAFTTWDTSHNWSSLSVGDPSQLSDVWAIDSTEQVYNFSGSGSSSTSSSGSWSPVSGSFGTKIVAINGTASCSGNTIHLPLVLNSSTKNVYIYHVLATQSCAGGGFTQVNGAAAVDIAAGGFAVDTSGNIDLYNPSTTSFGSFAGPITGGTAQIGALGGTDQVSGTNVVVGNIATMETIILK